MRLARDCGLSGGFLADDDVYYYIRWRLELEGETENTGVCTKERKGVTAAVLMATPCTNSLGGESGFVLFNFGGDITRKKQFYRKKRSR